MDDTDTRYDKPIEIDLSSLEPMLNGPFTPDRANPISEIAKTAREHGELVTALKLAGRLDFNPLTDELVTPGGEKFKLDPPTGHRLPSKGFDHGQDTYQEPPEQGAEAEIHVDTPQNVCSC